MTYKYYETKIKKAFLTKQTFAKFQKFLWLISMNEHEIFVEWHLFIISIELFFLLLPRLFLNCTHSFSDVINCLPRCQIPFHKWIDFVMKTKGLDGLEVEYFYMFETIVKEKSTLLEQSIYLKCIFYFYF